jgi:Flp pilus assembly protein TadD
MPQASSELPTIPGYEILQELGRGGMGVFYKARHFRLNRIVALKMILAADFASAETRERFQREAEAVARLQHANVVQLYEIGEAGRNQFFSLEFIEGQSLANRLQGTPVQPNQAAQLVETLCHAVHYAHERGIVHRDLKPANILLGSPRETPLEQCVAKIADYGLAKRLDEAASHTQSGAILGTPGYMAPEQAAGKSTEIGPAADVYALGAVFYELLTGRPPFAAPTALETIQRVLDSEPVPVRRLQPSTPRDLETICLKCLKKRPEQRYATAGLLADDLRAYLHGRPIQARRSGAFERIWKWVRRHPARTATAVLAALFLLLATAAAAWYLIDRAERAKQLADEFNRWQNLELQITAVHAEDDARARNLADTLSSEQGVHKLLSNLEPWKSNLDARQALLEQAEKLASSGAGRIHGKHHDQAKMQRERLRAECKLYELANELDAIHLESFTAVEEKWRPAAVGPKYAKFFSDRFQIEITTQDSDVIAKSLADSRLRYLLVAALDHWADLSQHQGSGYEQLLPRLLEVSSRIVNQNAWAQRFRRPDTWRDLKQLQSLAAEVNPAEQSPQVLIALAQQIDRQQGDGRTVLQSALVHHVGSFWLNIYAAKFAEEPAVKVGFHQAALAIRPNNNTAYNNLGIALSRRKRYAEAVSALKKAIDLGPKHPIPLANLGNVYYRQAQYPLAVTFLQQALAENPKLTQAYRTWGDLLYEQRQYTAALAKYNLVLKYDPSDFWTLGMVGDVHRKLNDFGAAVKAYEQAKALGSTSAEDHSSLGLVLNKLGRRLEACAAYQRAAELGPKNPIIQGNYGYTLAKLGKHEEATVLLQKAVALDSNDAFHQQQLALTLLRQDRYLEAQMAAQAALCILSDSQVKSRKELEAILGKSNRCLDVQCPSITTSPADLRTGVTGQLLATDPVDSFQAKDLDRPGYRQSEAVPLVKEITFRKAHAVQLIKDKSYQIDLQGDFDPVLRVESAVGRHLAHNDDRDPAVLSSRIVFTGPATANYKLVVNSYKTKAAGKYELRMQETERLDAGTTLDGSLSNSDVITERPTAMAQEQFNELANCFVKEHRLQLDAGVAYVLELASAAFCTRFVLLDSSRRQLAVKGAISPGVWGRSQLHFTPQTGGEYFVWVTSVDRGETGAYRLNVQGYR